MLVTDELERLCAIVAAMKICTINRKWGIFRPNGHLNFWKSTVSRRQMALSNQLTTSIVNLHLRRLGYDHDWLVREPPAMRFQAEYSNAIWHFDMSPSDIECLKAPSSIRIGMVRGH